MSYILKLGTISKYLESTKQPDVSSWTEYDVVFKDGADIVNPTVTLSVDLATVSAYNYGYMLNRYYWVTKKTMLRTGYCVLQLEADVLATYKNEIGNADLYILRSSAAYDGNIIDNFYPTKSVVTYYEENDIFYYTASPYANGFYVINVAGTASGGTSTLWKVSPSGFRNFITSLYTTIDGYQFSDIGEAIPKLLGGQPEKLVSSAMWFPSAINFTVKTPAEHIVVGGWDSGVNGNIIEDPVFTDSSIWIDLHKHPQAVTRGAYLNQSPFSIYTLSIPLFGTINLDTTALIGATQVHVYIRADALSGTATAMIDSGGNRPILANLTAQLGVPLPLAGQSSGSSVAGGIIRTLANTAVAIATGGASSIASAVASGIGTGVSALTGASFSTSSGGNILAPTTPIILNSTHFELVDEDNARNGRPYCRVAKPSTLGGFMIAQRGDVNINGTQPEEIEIKRFLESGFYYE